MRTGLKVRVLVAAVTVCVLTQAATAGEIQRRKQRQQKRIAAGIESGQLSPSEAARLEHQEAAVNREEQAMRDANDGHLTPGERRVINHQENRLSRRIHRQKHDDNDR